MYSGPFDLSRPGGLMSCSTRDGGLEVHMYLDEPGVYYDGQHKPVSEEIAQAAGFDVAKFKKERQKLEATRAAMAKIEAEFPNLKVELKPAPKAPAPDDDGRERRIAAGHPLATDFTPIGNVPRSSRKPYL